MIKLQNIMTTINAKLRDKFNLDVNENDISKGFKRPSFFVRFDDIYKIDHLYNFERGLTVRIYYFPSDRNKYQLEVLEIQQAIEELFKLGLTVEDRYLSIIHDIQSEVIDGVLEVSFGLRYYDSNPVGEEGPKMEKMEELSLNV